MTAVPGGEPPEAWAGARDAAKAAREQAEQKKAVAVRAEVELARITEESAGVQARLADSPAADAAQAALVRLEELGTAVTDARAREQTAGFTAEYARRAGIEGTIAQGVRSSRLRRTPYFGQAKTHLAHLMTAAAMNLARLLRWLADKPKAQTRHSAFAQLHPLAA